MATWHSGNEYSHKDMLRMQQEAVERVREMQERSRKAVEEANSHPAYPGFVKAPAEPPAPPSPQEEAVNHIRAPGQPVYQIPQPGPQAQQHRSGPLGALFGEGGALGSLGSLLGGKDGEGPISRVMAALGIDNDKLIILALLLVLINNQADKKLILALLYILL